MANPPPSGSTTMVWMRSAGTIVWKAYCGQVRGGNGSHKSQGDASRSVDQLILPMSKAPHHTPCMIRMLVRSGKMECSVSKQRRVCSLNWGICLLAGLVFLALHPVHARQPNVILIYTDDRGSVDLNCYGAKDLYTPHLDQLAKEGIRFTQFYSAAPVCSPSRAAVLTGRFPQHAGVPGNVSSQQGHGGMPAHQTTMAELLKASGYTTGHIGKWHLGYTPATMPNGQGFDHSFGHMGGASTIGPISFTGRVRTDTTCGAMGRNMGRRCILSDLMVQETEHFLQTNKDKPFFLYWAINVPHYPRRVQKAGDASINILKSPEACMQLLFPRWMRKSVKCSASSTVMGSRKIRSLSFSRIMATQQKCALLEAAEAPALTAAQNSACLRAVFACLPSFAGRGNYRATRSGINLQPPSTGFQPLRTFVWNPPSAQADRWQESKTHPYLG